MASPVPAGFVDCFDGLCGRDDCIECNPDVLCPTCRLPDEDCSCDDEEWGFGG